MIKKRATLTRRDFVRSAETFNKFPGAKQYGDFRKMFDEMEKEIDAVVVATPDHCHAVAAMAAINPGPIIRLTSRPSGAGRCPSAMERSATGPVMSLTLSFGRWTRERRRQSKPK